MSTIRKAVKKTLIDTDVTKRVLEALTEKDPKDIVHYMAKDCPRTLVDICKRMDGAIVPTGSVATPKDMKGVKMAYDETKESLEALYETGEYTHDDLVDAALDMTEGEIDRYTARMLVDEIFMA